MVFNELITPIKWLRTLSAPARFETYRNSNGELCIREQNVGLKEAKDFVEACMAYGVRRYLDAQVADQKRIALNAGPLPYNDDIKF